jgi:UDP:flavonoid glycosyltransferase YjiC (YdhE family)
LPEGDIKNFIDNSKNGAILMSMGSVVKPSLLGHERMQTFLQAFKKLPYNVLWKTDYEFKDLPANVKTYKWLPQNDILAHPNLKLFITHGGLRSMEESIAHKVPILTIPFSYDQPYNAEVIVHYGIGEQYDLNQLTVESFVNAIFRVILNEKYKTKMIEMHENFDNVTATSREIAVFEIEKMIRNRNITEKFVQLNRFERIFYEERQVDCYLFTLFLGYIFYKIVPKILRVCKTFFTILRRMFL